MAVKLSVLICHVPARGESLARVLADLGTRSDVEVLIDGEDSRTIGEKRNRLLARARGEYVSFVDDDDRVAPNYTDLVFSAMVGKPDCIGLRGVILFRYNMPRYFLHTLQVDKWYTNEGDHTYYRTPNHLNPIRREIIEEMGGFNPNKSYGEDIEFSRTIKPLLKTETMVDDVLYYYLYNKTDAATADGRRPL